MFGSGVSFAANVSSIDLQCMMMSFYFIVLSSHTLWQNYFKGVDLSEFQVGWPHWHRAELSTWAVFPRLSAVDWLNCPLCCTATFLSGGISSSCMALQSMLAKDTEAPFHSFELMTLRLQENNIKLYSGALWCWTFEVARRQEWPGPVWGKGHQTFDPRKSHQAHTQTAYCLGWHHLVSFQHEQVCAEASPGDIKPRDTQTHSPGR